MHKESAQAREIPGLHNGIYGRGKVPISSHESARALTKSDAHLPGFRDSGLELIAQFLKWGSLCRGSGAGEGRVVLEGVESVGFAIVIGIWWYSNVIMFLGFESHLSIFIF